jgi:hypothetical protein
MKDLTKFFLLSVMVTPFACTPSNGDSGEEDSADSADPSGDPGECVANEEVTGEITEDTTWSCDKILGDLVTVSNNAVLTVDPGVVVRGKSGSALIVAQGSRLEAAGTADAPIVFTSAEPEGGRARGDWGGIIILGNAATNLEGGTGLAEGLEKNSAFGGGASPDKAYSCGTLKYVRVEFAGFELTTDNELNGIGLLRLRLGHPSSTTCRSTWVTTTASSRSAAAGTARTSSSPAPPTTPSTSTPVTRASCSTSSSSRTRRSPTTGSSGPTRASSSTPSRPPPR